MRFLLFILAAVSQPAIADEFSVQSTPSIQSSAKENSREETTKEAVSAGWKGSKLSFGRPAIALGASAFYGALIEAAVFEPRWHTVFSRDMTKIGFSLNAPAAALSSHPSSPTRNLDSGPAAIALRGGYRADTLARLGQIAAQSDFGGDSDPEVFRLGTALSQGFSSPRPERLSNDTQVRPRLTGVYLGLDVTNAVSLGLSQGADLAPRNDQIPSRLGIGAAYKFGSDRFVSGAVGNVTGSSQSIGRMLGLQF